VFVNKSPLCALEQISAPLGTWPQCERASERHAFQAISLELTGLELQAHEHRR
jgi:hypothetical protein